jgi:hypothetical protein
MEKALRFFQRTAAVFFAAALLWGCQQPIDSWTEAQWTAQADGDGARASTKIDFTFDRDIAGLTADAIVVTDDTGSVTKGELTGSGAEWSLGVAVRSAGNVTVFINKDGVDGGEKSVPVHKGLVSWSAQADGEGGSGDSTLIVFALSGAVEELSAEDITIADGTGSVIKGALSGGGASWSLGIAVETAGDVTVAINKDGIEAAARSVAVYKAGQTAAITWTAQADGASGVENSTAIGFVFSGAVAELHADDILVATNTGSVVKGALSGGGASWSLGIAVEAAGDVTVSVNKEGIETTARSVAVYKAGESAAITWTAQANGAGDSIAFVFSGAIAELSAGDIVIAADTGSVTKGTLSGGGANWSLGIVVAAEGDVKVAITKAGIEAAEKIVAVRKAPVPGGIAYDAAADGGSATASTKINFTFGGEVAGLTADHITVANGTGAVTKGALSGGGTSWSLGIAVTAAGDVKVKITKAGVEAVEKTVAVYKAPVLSDIAYDAVADGGSASASTKINFTFGGEVAGLTADNITVANGTGAVTKGALSGGGTSWSLGIAVTAAGDVKVKISKAGVEAAEKTVAVYKAPVPGGEDRDITYDASADGGSASASAKINFTFSAAVAGLTADNITVANGTGAVTKGALSGGGTSWSLGIAVAAAGTVKVKITKAGVEAAEKTVTVYKAPAPSDIAYDAAADGGSATASTKIDLTFGAAVAGLTADNITIANGTGGVTKGALSGGGTSWSLGIAVTAAGTVKVKITKAGIEAAEKTVTVYKAPVPSDIAYDAAADGGSATASTKIDFTFGSAVAGLTADNITIANGTGGVTKGTLSGGGTSWSLGIAVSAAGTVKVKIAKAGIEAAEKTVTVHKPLDIAYSAVADGNAATTSTKIDFVFDKAVAGLTAADIAVVNGSGAVTKGTLTGGGASWSLGIAVTTAGNVTVAIHKAGIEAAEKTVTVSKAPVPDIAYSAAADGDAATTSAKIDFVFDRAVAGLTAADIAVVNGSGAVTKGALTGGGASWSLGIAVAAAGNVTVKITKTGVEAAEKVVAVHKAPVVNNDIAYGAVADGGASTSSTSINLTFTAAVEGLTVDAITVANGTGAVTKGTLTGGGTSWSLGIAVTAGGTVTVKIAKAGIEAWEKTVTVHKFIPIAYTAATDGGSAVSTKIEFVFDAAVAGLLAGDISIVNGTGSATKGTLTGGGTSWSLGIAVTAPGTVKVAINKDGIEAGERTVTVSMAPSLITYDAAADSTGGTEASGRIDFIFSEAVDGLNLGHLRYEDDTGSAYPMELSGGGQEWSLTIVTIRTGDIRVGIERDGIEDTEKLVAVYKPEEAQPEVPIKTGITVIMPPETTLYAKNQTFDRTGLEVGWVYSNGSIEPIPAGGYTLEEPDMGRPTTKLVTIQAGSYTTGFWIQVRNSDKALSYITVEGPTNKTQDFGKEFDRTGLVVTGHYSDGSTSSLASLATIVGYDKFKRGPQTASVKVNGKTAALEGITTRIGAAAAVSVNNTTYGSNYDILALNHKNIYVKGEAITPRNSNLQIAVSPNGNIGLYSLDMTYLTLDNGGFTEQDFATITGYNPYQPGWQAPSLTLDGRTISFDVRVIDTEPAVWFDYGYMRHDGDPTGRGPGAGKYYAKPDETLVIAPVRYLLGYNADHSDAGASYSWTVSGGESSRTWTTSKGGELLRITPKTTGTYTITVDVTGRDYAGGGAVTKTASAELVCYADPLPAGTFASPLRNLGPGQFSEYGSGYGWSLGSAGGYEVWTVEHQPSYYIRGNPFSAWQEAGVVWMQEDKNGNGLPDEMWYELRGGDDDEPAWRDKITRRYAIMYVKGDGTPEQHMRENTTEWLARKASYWVDNKGRSGLIKGGFPSNWGVTGDWVTYTCTLLRDNGNITGGYSDLAPMSGYVDAENATFYVNKAMGADGTPVTLSAVKFIKVHTGILRYGQIFGDVSTEIKYADFLGWQSDFPDP